MEFSYKMEFVLPKQSKNLDPSYKTDLDLWDSLGRAKLIIAKIYRTDLVIYSHSRERKPCLITE